MTEITRVEVVDETGRAYVRHNAEVTTSTQDDGRTLKVFVRSPHDELRQQLASKLHAMFCTYAHEDQCSWYYENERGDGDARWTGSAHQDWLRQADRLREYMKGAGDDGD
jgi:hypothetical protein